jgi:hypothetical protein
MNDTNDWFTSFFLEISKKFRVRNSTTDQQLLR